MKNSQPPTLVLIIHVNTSIYSHSQLTNTFSYAFLIIISLPAMFFRVAGHPLAQNEKCLHMFLQEPSIDKTYTPGKVRNT